MCCVVGSALMVVGVALVRLVKRRILHLEEERPEAWLLTPEVNAEGAAAVRPGAAPVVGAR